ncbi:hypothetical protein ACJRO7_017570 [Eucalyptus globulus]|uniref:Ubiquitin-like domain-containing protein n=1 Tax=Eucalyptus globulus TaxID=34317 RepID=A0ABD3KUW1_EUCGL
MPPSKMHLHIKVNMNDPMKPFREVVWFLEDVPLEWGILFANGTDLEDDHRICYYELQKNSSVDIQGKPLLKKFEMIVLPWKANLKVVVEVKPWDKVKILRKELEKGIFFIHKQSRMDEDKSFKWRDIKMGDNIEVFRGTMSR